MVLFQFLKDRVQLAWTEDFEALGRVVNGKLVGAVGFHGFNGASCFVHMAGDPGWMTRGLMETAVRYAFVTRELNMIFGLVPSGNTKAREIDLRMGFEELQTIPGAHPDGALHLLVMKRENCRWLERKHGWEERSKAA
jgi:RimJ/RimL family protein N-acetyltransferase